MMLRRLPMRVNAQALTRTTSIALRSPLLTPYPSSLIREPLALSKPTTPVSLRFYSANNGKNEKEEKDSKALTTEPLSTRVWGKVKHEAQHYWHGSKLLAKEIRISARLQARLLRGKTLTRRERRQLKRTTSDILRLIPFVPFVLIPFMELLLPVALKLFPNMLPSTFEDKFAADEKKRKLLRVRLEMAKFLQETIKESGIRASESVTGSDEFKEFFRKIRTTGEHPSHSDIVKVARLFNNDLTLDNLSRPQLVSMCRYMNINAFGTDNYLRGHIRRRLEHLKRDDVLIQAEGVESLSTSELQHACQSRGIRVATHSNARLRDDLSQWVELHTTQEISGVLLVLSKAFNFAHLGDSVMASLEATLCSLPDVLLNEAELEVSDEATYKQKLDVLQEQEELIEDEAEQEQKEVEARQAQREVEKARKEEELEKAKNLLPDSAIKQEDDVRMTPEQLGELGQALSILSAKSSVLKEREELQTLIEQTREAEKQAEEAQAGLPEEEKKIDKTNENVKKQVKSMIQKIDTQLSDYDEKVGTQLNLIQVNHLGQISIHDLKQALRVIKHSPDEEVIDTIVHKLDVDKDGLVMLDDVVELAQEEGLGIVLDDSAEKIVDQGNEIRNEKHDKIKKEEIVH
ncbi:LETM1-domain-containing protein [Wallemia mellicola]|uniref:Mitochondrial proton/calcium exchanger protein n=1 Tax=Wallemia mellicola TaxID=1708541 RepID=A0A4T0MH15_9BASI|nr:LETM1-domain-containing protein [Wallemia mellicola]